MAVFQFLKSKLFKPLVGLSNAGISTTLAACYGPPPEDVNREAARRDFCEPFLLQACTDDSVELPEACPIAPEEQAQRCASNNK